MDVLCPGPARRGPGREGGVSGSHLSVQGGHGRAGRLELRPSQAGRAPQPERGGGAARLVARERHAAARLRADVHGRWMTGPVGECAPGAGGRRRGRWARRRSGTAARSAGTSGWPRRPGTRCRRCSWSVRRGRGRLGRGGVRTLPCCDFLVGPKRNAARAGRADLPPCCVKPSRGRRRRS